MIELIQDIKLLSYEEGRKFNVLKHLKNLRKELSGESRPEKMVKFQSDNIFT